MTGGLDMLFNIASISLVSVILLNGSETYVCHEGSICEFYLTIDKWSLYA